MELKPLIAGIWRGLYELLIVPYGIETGFAPLGYYLYILLIVPYGIETYTKRAGSH